ncbi:hypothetical protein ACI2L4_04300 [Streptomyces sparsogenes]|uniref:hypothetical protein n=1 Tax=Streptomyces sparsogenes TaxID=67365 RepID=UPI00384DD353
MPNVSPESLENPENPWSYSLRLPHDPRAAAIARTTLRAVLARHGMGELADPATLVASDLDNSRSSLFSWRLRGAGSPGAQAAT